VWDVGCGALGARRSLGYTGTSIDFFSRVYTGTSIDSIPDFFFKDIFFLG